MRGKTHYLVSQHFREPRCFSPIPNYILWDMWFCFFYLYIKCFSVSSPSYLNLDKPVFFEDLLWCRRHSLIYTCSYFKDQNSLKNLFPSKSLNLPSQSFSLPVQRVGSDLSANWDTRSLLSWVALFVNSYSVSQWKRKSREERKHIYSLQKRFSGEFFLYTYSCLLLGFGEGVKSLLSSPSVNTKNQNLEQYFQPLGAPSLPSAQLPSGHIERQACHGAKAELDV